MHDIAGEAQRMSRLVNDLLALARADAGVLMEKKPVEFMPLVQEVVRRAQLLEHTAEWQVGDLECARRCGRAREPGLFAAIVVYFHRKCVQVYTVGTCTVRGVRERIALSVFGLADTGIGMDKEDIPHIFDRFYRADLSRGITSGTGLGLSIAKWIIDEHGGSVEVTTRKDEGSTFIIWLPANFPLSV